MTTVKIQQKLGLDGFKKLNDQIKSDGVHLVVSDEQDAANRVINMDNVLCKVNSAFALGKKIEVVLNDKIVTKGYDFRFHQFNDVFYLVRK